MKRKIIPMVLASLLVTPGVHAQSSTPLVGFGESYWRYAADPSGATVFSFVPHCRQFGVRDSEDTRPPGYLFFSPEIEPMGSTYRWLGVAAFLQMQRGFGSLFQATLPLIRLPSC
ncbi:hypothetical protein [Burkholderia sp. 3C]